MAKYRKLVERFWSDPRVYPLTPTRKNLMAYCITGYPACRTVQLSGIYEIHRGTLAQNLNIDIEQVEEDLDYFNQKKPMLLEYDPEEHMLFVKSFFKYNSSYRPNIAALMEDFDTTFHKAPEFWAEFGQLHRERLGKVYVTLESEEQREFLDRLFELENEIVEPDTIIKNARAKPLQKSLVKSKEK